MNYAQVQMNHFFSLSENTQKLAYYCIRKRSSNSWNVLKNIAMIYCS